MLNRIPIHITLSASDRRIIDDEHARLDRFLRDLCETCPEFTSLEDCHNCGHEKTASCQGRLPSFFYDFHDLVAEHFENEEKIMAGKLQSEEERDYLRRHQEEHARLMREVRSLIKESTELSQRGNVAAAIRRFHHLIKDRFSEHADSYDKILLGAGHD